METIDGLHKAECIRTGVFHQDPFKTIAEIEYATAGWVDWYNNRKLHLTLGMVPPVEYETTLRAFLLWRSAGAKTSTLFWLLTRPATQASITQSAVVR
jgi:hypothetical protein